MIEIQKLKKSIPAIIDLKLIENIRKFGKLVSFQPNEVIIEPGNYIKSVPIVIEGTIKVLREDEEGKEVFLYYLEPGDTCAITLTCCSTYLPSEIKAIAEEPTMIISIPINKHEDWTHEFKQWKEFVAQTYQKRFNELLRTIDDIAFKKMDERLIKYLNRKARQSDSNILKITHQEIARDMGTSREVISRLLKQLENDGHITLSRNLITIDTDYKAIADQL